MFLLLPELIFSPGTCSMDSAVNTLQRAGCGEPEALWAPCLAAQPGLVGQFKEGLWELFCSDWLVQRIFSCLAFLVGRGLSLGVMVRNASSC